MRRPGSVDLRFAMKPSKCRQQEHDATAAHKHYKRHSVHSAAWQGCYSPLTRLLKLDCPDAVCDVGPVWHAKNSSSRTAEPKVLGHQRAVICGFIPNAQLFAMLSLAAHRHECEVCDKQEHENGGSCDHASAKNSLLNAGFKSAENPAFDADVMLFRYLFFELLAERQKNWQKVFLPRPLFGPTCNQQRPWCYHLAAVRCQEDEQIKFCLIE